LLLFLFWVLRHIALLVASLVVARNWSLAWAWSESFTVAIIIWLTAKEHLCHRWPRICSVCCSHNPVLPSLYMIYNWIFSKRSGERMPTPTPEHLSSPCWFIGARVSQYLVFCVVFYRSLCPFSSWHCIVSLSIYAYLLPL
jgi:hypothetical protein